MLRSLAILIALVVTSPLPGDPGSFCATGPETERRLAELSRRTSATRALHAASNAAPAPPTTRFADDFLLVAADQETVPNDDPADLEGMTFEFTPRGGNRISMVRRALDYDEAIGERFVSFDRDPSPRPYTLS